MQRLIGLMALAASALLAADVNGNWKATAEGPNGPMERTFSFKTDGDKLTGDTTSSIFGTSSIENGKVEGDIISFQIKVKFEENEMLLTYKGKVTKSDEIQFTVESPNIGQVIEWKAKKVS